MENLNFKLPQYVDLKLDSGFKAVFADRRNSELLRKMLNLLLPESERIAEIEEYLDREQLPDFRGGKETALDILCRADDGRRFIVEMQRRDKDAFFERCVYYGSGLFRQRLQEGDSYAQLHPVFVVGILDYNLRHEDESLWDTDNVVSEYQMTEKRTGELAPPTISCIFAELKRFTKKEDECRSDRDWLFYIFKRGGVPGSLAQEPRSAFAGELIRACEVAGFDREKKLIFEKDMIRDLDKLAEDAFAKRVAREEGLAEGEAKKANEIATNMLVAGLSVTQIASCTGLSEEEVLALRRN